MKSLDTSRADAEQISNSLEAARSLVLAEQVVQAELLLRQAAIRHKTSVEPLLMLADLAREREDLSAASRWLAQAHMVRPQDLELSFEAAGSSLDADEPMQAQKIMRAVLAREPRFAPGWLMLAEALSAVGEERQALKARFQAVFRAQSAGLWTDQSTTPAEILPAVVRAIGEVREARRQVLQESFGDLRRDHGSELDRVSLAVRGYLGEIDLRSPDTRQRPKFLYFPDLPIGPYHDPFLQPWATRLRDAFPEIRKEAQRLLESGHPLEDFMGFKPGDDREKYVGGTGHAAAWDAFFFYRKGRRFDDNHNLAPSTSAVLEGIDLCRIKRQTPEVCFSVMTPGTHIKAHYGVTNTRLVVHLPLIIPRDCALNIVGVGAHHWVEGELMMFDDTFEHEAWNRSDQSRVILLMDAWNPLLTPIERQAVHQVVEAIDDFERFEL